ncbi:MAG: protein-glutamate O-methyltransferase [Pseudomonadota bacterium]
MNRPVDHIPLGPDDFEAIAALAYRESGLQLVAEKTSMIQSRLRHRIRELGLVDFEAYTSFVCSSDGKEERRHMIAALTTNVSHFFRESHHFDLMIQSIQENTIPKLKAGNRLRIWSAGCSNGQEAVSVCIKLLEAFPQAKKWDIKILATDIDPNVLRFGNQGIYHERLTASVPKPLLGKYFTESVSNGENSFKTTHEVRQMISFKELNLLANWPMKRRMDFIFCRNVVIYFDQKTQNALWPRFHTQLKPNGLLFVGHSERVPDPEKIGFESCGPTTYCPLQANCRD